MACKGSGVRVPSAPLPVASSLQGDDRRGLGVSRSVTVSPSTASAVRLTYFGHATVGIDLAGVRLLTDPVLRGHVAFLRRIAPAPPPEQLRDIGAMLVSHLHHDHCDPPSLARLGRDRTLVVPWGTESFFHRHGFTQVVALRPGGTHVLAAGAGT